jgi:hypothetical protein
MNFVARRRVFEVVAFGTLFLNAYLILGLLATLRMPREMHVFLPLYGSEWFAAIPRGVILGWATVTTMAASALLFGKSRAEESGAPTKKVAACPRTARRW